MIKEALRVRVKQKIKAVMTRLISDTNEMGIAELRKLDLQMQELLEMQDD